MKLEDFSGQRFGRLSVISRTEKGGKYVRWSCVCDCGNFATVSSTHLKTGHTKSCGCVRNEIASDRARSMAKHGMWNTPEWNCWKAMKDRCLRKTHSKYHLYGGRGITVCQVWIDSFDMFFAHIGHRPGPSHSIDRIDSSNGYEPGNVRWADNFQQNNNKRNNVTIEVDGVSMTAAELSRRFGITHRAAVYRIRNGLPIGGENENRPTSDRV